MQTRVGRLVGVVLAVLLTAEVAPAMAAASVEAPERAARPTVDLPTLASPEPAARELSVPSGDFPMVPGPDGRPQWAPPVRDGGPKPTRVSELEEERDLVSESWARSDGTVETVVHGEPINFVDPASGDWERVDNRLVPDPARAGSFVNAANGWVARFSPIGPGGAGGVEVVTARGSMRMAPDGLQATIAPQVGTGDAADTVTYPAVWPGVDLVYRVTSVSVKEELVVRETPKSSEFSFVVDGADLRDQGSRADVAVDGALGQDLGDRSAGGCGA